jgi:hypothetical protein
MVTSVPAFFPQNRGVCSWSETGMEGEKCSLKKRASCYLTRVSLIPFTAVCLPQHCLVTLILSFLLSHLFLAYQLLTTGTYSQNAWKPYNCVNSIRLACKVSCCVGQSSSCPSYWGHSHILYQLNAFYFQSISCALGENFHKLPAH